MASLRTLNFLNNNLSGPIPQSWQVNSNGQPHFVNLQSLSLLPGVRHSPKEQTSVQRTLPCTIQHPLPCTMHRSVHDLLCVVPELAGSLQEVHMPLRTRAPLPRMDNCA